MVLSGHDNFVASAAFSPDGSRIVSASFDGTARIWDAATGREIAVQVTTMTPVPFTMEGTRYRTVLDSAIGRFAWGGQESLGINEHLRRSYP